MSPRRPRRVARQAHLIVATGLLSSTIVTWRQAAYYSGGVDPVVAAKALLGLLALWIAWRARRAETSPRPVNLRSLGYLAATGVISTFGAWSTGALLAPSIVLFVRVALIAVTVFLLVRVYEVGELVRTLSAWLAAIVAASALTGSTQGSLRTGSGRLIGGIPPLQPNELAQLCALAILVLLWSDLVGRSRSVEWLGLLGLLGALWLTQSRTTLAFLMVALIVMISRAKRLRTRYVVVVLVALPVLVYALIGTEAATRLVDRGGSTNVLSLSQRTVAWSAALHLHHGFWAVLFGNGLARTSIPVVAQYRTSQILDSSWISALVQTGLLGVLVLAAWFVDALVHSVGSPENLRRLFVPVLLFVLGLSVLESGVIGATPEFVALLLIGLTAGAPRSAPPASPRPSLQVIFGRGRAAAAPAEIALR